MQIDRRRVLTLAALAVPASMLHGQSAAETERDQIEHTDLAALNAGIIRRQNGVQNGGDAAAAAEFFAEDTRNHGVPVGRKGVLRVLTDIINTFPDWHTQIEDLAAIGDDVITRVISTGTHKGVGKIPVNGGLLVGVPPTGNTFKVQSIHWHTLKNGLIVEHRASRDDIGMMQQLGLLPAVKRYDLPQK
jgi:predicted ester cyclase